MTQTTLSTAAEPGSSTADGAWDLEAVLANRRWVRRTNPFPHVVAYDVFVPEFYRKLEAQFVQVMDDHPEAFTRTMKNYDASGANLTQSHPGPLGIFVSREWHDMLVGAAGVQASGDVSASLHHHDPGGKSGWPHNDLNPGWFGHRCGAGQVTVAGEDGVAYQTGNAPEGVDPREMVRAVSLLFYLGNPPWQQGDGGETGLYRGLGATPAQAVAAVPPVNNSLMFFECTPYSYHGFISNRYKPRNSLVMWLHRGKAETVSRWGDDSIVYWT